MKKIFYITLAALSISGGLMAVPKIDWTDVDIMISAGMYNAGYEDGYNCRPKDLDDHAYSVGYSAGVEQKKLELARRPWPFNRKGYRK